MIELIPSDEQTTFDAIAYQNIKDLLESVIDELTPKEAIMKLESAVKATVESDAFMAASKKMGFKPAFLGHAEFGTLIENDDKRISTLMVELGLKK